MSRLRPSLPTDNSGQYPCMKNGTAYLMILRAVETKSGLIHGRLHAYGESCAIGSYFDVNPQTVLYSDLIDEVAAVNDSVPTYTKKRRKAYVAQWLRWKLRSLGFPVTGRPTKEPAK